MAINPLEQLWRVIPLFRNRQLPDLTGININNITDFSVQHRNFVLENWWFYHGFHNFFLKRFEGENDQVYLARINEATIENQIKPIINLITSYLYGDTPKRYVNRAGVSDQRIQTLLENTVWGFNQTDKLDDEKALNALVSGYTIVQRRLIDMRTGKDFTLNPQLGEIQKYGYIKKELLDSSVAVPLPYIDDNGIIYPSRLGGILYIAEQDSYVANQVISRALGRAPIRQDIIEYVDDKVWLKFVRPAGEQDWQQITINPGTKYVNQNQYGRIDTPFTLYKNTGDPFYIEGDSDVADMRSLNMELNELANGDKETIYYHQFPILAIMGGKLPDNFVRTKNSIVEFPDNDATKTKMEYITWDGKIDASQKRQETIRETLSDVTGIGQIGRGLLRNMGQVRSGPPLKAMFTSDRAVMSRKFKYFKAGETSDMYADVRFYEFHSGENFEVDKTVTFNCEFERDFLGIDALLEAEIQALRTQSGSESPEQILRDEHPDWTEKELQAALSQINDAAAARRGSIGPISQSPQQKSIQQGKGITK